MRIGDGETTMLETINSYICIVQITPCIDYHGYLPDIGLSSGTQHPELHHGSSLLLLGFTLRSLGLHEHALHSGISGQNPGVLLTAPSTSHLTKNPDLLRSLLEERTPQNQAGRGRRSSHANSATCVEQLHDSAPLNAAAFPIALHDVHVSGDAVLLRHTISDVKTSYVAISSVLFELAFRLHGFITSAPQERASGRQGSKRLSGAPSLSENYGQVDSKPDSKGKTPLKLENGFQVAVYDSNDKLKRARLGCLVDKAGKSQPACDHARHHWKLVRSLCRSKHLREHAAKGDITDLQLRGLKAMGNRNTRPERNDDLAQEEPWRDCFVYLYAGYSGIRGQLNPYVGEPLLDLQRHSNVTAGNLWQGAGEAPQHMNSRPVNPEVAAMVQHQAEATTSSAYTTTPMAHAEPHQVTSTPPTLASPTFAQAFPAILDIGYEQAGIHGHTSNDDTWQLSGTNAINGPDRTHQFTRPSVPSPHLGSPLYAWRASNLVPGTESTPTTMHTPSMTTGTSAAPPGWDETLLAPQLPQLAGPMIPRDEALVGIQQGYLDPVSSPNPEELSDEFDAMPSTFALDDDMLRSFTFDNPIAAAFTFDDQAEQEQTPLTFVGLPDLKGAKPGNQAPAQ